MERRSSAHHGLQRPGVKHVFLCHSRYLVQHPLPLSLPRFQLLYAPVNLRLEPAEVELALY